MPVIGDEYYRCQSCGEAWFVEQRRFRIRRDRDLEFFSEEEVYRTPAPTTHLQIDYVCATCGEPLVRNGLRRFVRQPPVLVANLRSEINAIKERLDQAAAASPDEGEKGGGERLNEAIEKLSARLGRLEELIALGAHGQGSTAGEGSKPQGTGQPDQPGGDPAPDGDGAGPKQGRKKSK